MELSFKYFIAVVVGGALGAVARYLMMIGVGHWFGHGFPFATVLINIIGAFLLGSFVQISALFWSPSPELRIFITVGVLGSFTTFSTLALDVYMLWGRGEVIEATGYVAVSIIFGIVAFFTGVSVFRSVLQ